MKKTLILSALIILILFVVLSFNKGKKELPDGFFDTKPDDVTDQTQEEVKNPLSENGNDVTQKGDGENTNPDNTEGADSGNNKEPDNDTDTENGNDAEKDNPENFEVPFSHSEEEKAKIVSRYNEAESLYYDILSQNFELDNMDVVTAVADGYETNFHRVILGNVNSLSELRALYGGYFTTAFINSIDLSAYREADGKLYCAPTQGSASGKGSNYTTKIESIDETNAVVVRRDSKSGGVQKIPAVKHSNIWYFGGVAVR